MTAPTPRIIDPASDTDYVTEVRILLGITSNELTDAELKTDIILGVAERNIIGEVDNWQSIVDGANDIKSAALRAAVIIRVALNVISSPAIQNILIDQTRLIDVIITAKKVPLEELRNNLMSMLDEQLASSGIVYTDGYPTHTAVGKTDKVLLYEYAVDDSGGVAETGK